MKRHERPPYVRPQPVGPGLTGAFRLVELTTIEEYDDVLDPEWEDELENGEPVYLHYSATVWGTHMHVECWRMRPRPVLHPDYESHFETYRSCGGETLDALSFALGEGEPFTRTTGIEDPRTGGSTRFPGEWVVIISPHAQ